MIIFDLDGTLADCEHRRYFVENPYSIDGESPDCNCSDEVREWSCPFDDWSAWKPDWKGFYEECDKDKPIESTLEILRMFLLFKRPVQIWSGRCDSVRQKTIDWLSYQISMTICWGTGKWENHLKMRPIGDYTPDDQLKELWLDEEISQGNNIEMVFDDRPKVVRMWRRRGIFVFDCNQNGEEF